MWGWVKITSGTYKKEKRRLLGIIDTLDKRAEVGRLLDEDFLLCRQSNDQLAKLLREEEIKWYQRAKVKHLLEGDSNTKYFHLVTSGKHRKQHIFQLEQEEGIIWKQHWLREYITTYYKKLFGPHESNNFSLDESRVSDIPQVSEEENFILTAPFSIEKVRVAVFVMEHNKAPGPDGFPTEFYQVFWEIIKGDLMALFADFHSGRLHLFSLNFAIITLLPKKRCQTDPTV